MPVKATGVMADGPVMDSSVTALGLTHKRIKFFKLPSSVGTSVNLLWSRCLQTGVGLMDLMGISSAAGVSRGNEVVADGRMS